MLDIVSEEIAADMTRGRLTALAAPAAPIAILVAGCGSSNEVASAAERAPSDTAASTETTG